MPDIKSPIFRKVVNALLLGAGALICLALSLSAGAGGLGGL